VVLRLELELNNIIDCDVTQARRVVRECTVATNNDSEGRRRDGSSRRQDSSKDSRDTHFVKEEMERVINFFERGAIKKDRNDQTSPARNATETKGLVEGEG